MSRDEDRKQYVSIENQRLILNQYATEHGFQIDRFYEDDNVSGYTFERPGLRQMLTDIDTGLVKTVLAKDLSRIGRHNARVLLLIEDFKEQGIRLILTNDEYDSFETEDDDILGIKTWYNERYVKDASKKLKKVLRARQKEGSLSARPCFGYRVTAENKQKVEVVEYEAQIIRQIFELYLNGNGYRRIAMILNEEGVYTPSYCMWQRKSRNPRSQLAKVWSSEMVRDILKNDYYMGRLRTHIRERKTIHGTDLRVPEEEQYVFEDHHEAIISPNIFKRVQEIMTGRIRNDYRGQRRNYSIFNQSIFCKDCGKRMNLVVRTKRKKQKYFICRTYNAKGRQYCTSHLVDEDELLNAVFHYLQLCWELLNKDIDTYDMETQKKAELQAEAMLKELDVLLYKQQRKLDIILEQKITKMAEDREQAEILEKSYSKLEQDVLWQIKKLQHQMEEIQSELMISKENKDKSVNAAEVLKQVIDKKELTTQDVELLIDKIMVEADGSFEICLRYGLAAIVNQEQVLHKLRNEKSMDKDILEIVLEEATVRGYTSAKQLNRRLREKGWKTSLRTVVPLLNNLVEQGIIMKSDNSLKPYPIIKTQDYIKQLILDIDIV